MNQLVYTMNVALKEIDDVVNTPLGAVLATTTPDSNSNILPKVEHIYIRECRGRGVSCDSWICS